MALIIHELTTDEMQRYDEHAMKIIALVGPEKQHMLTFAVTVETPKDLSALQMVIDAFISKQTTLLPDYRGFRIPCGKMLSFIVHTGTSVLVSFFEVAPYKVGASLSYEVPTAEKLALPDPETQRGWLEQSN